MSFTTLAVGQINTIIGNFNYNTDKIVTYTEEAHSRGADVICFPEMAVCGYPPLDLLDRPEFIDRNAKALNEIAGAVPADINVILGYVEANHKQTGKKARNTAAWLYDGEVIARYHKTLIPTYDVFNEARYFDPGDGPEPIERDGRYAMTICEDIWNDPDFTYSNDQPRYDENPLKTAAGFSPDVVFNLSASPFIRGKDRFRTEMVKGLAEKHDTAIVMANMIGGNDSLIFDGTSLIVDSSGQVKIRGRSFQEDLLICDLDSDRSFSQEFLSGNAGVYSALQLGLSDYAHKSGYSEAVLGLSGGIDSTVTATLAADALGPDNVHGILMPSVTSSEESVAHAKKHADNIGIETVTVNIGDVFEDYLELFGDHFDGFEGSESGGIENKNQHRIRGNILTTLSNKYGYLPIGTGNKTELALGYTTLYGDLTGLLAPLGDVPKTMVYDLAGWRNQQSDVIPREIIEKAPSAELAIGQRDEDDLGSYETIDKILEGYLEDRMSRRELLDAGHPEETVDRVIRMIDLSEYKRRQAPTSLTVTSKRNFAGGRLVPEVNHFYRQEYEKE